MFKAISTIVFFAFALICFSQQAKSNYSMPTEKGDVEMYLLTVEEYNSLIDKIEKLEKSNKGNEKIIIDGISKELAQKIKTDLDKNKKSTISNKYLESELIAYGVLIGVIRKEDSIDYEKAYTKGEIIDKLKNTK